MNGSEDVIVIGKPLEPPDSPLNRDVSAYLCLDAVN